MTRVACIGEAMIELSMSTPPEIGVAGDTFNTAVYLKRLAPQLDVSFVTRLGTDDFSETIKAEITRQGVSTDHIETSQHRIPGLYAITTKDGERSFTYWRDQSAARDLFQTDSDPDFSNLAEFDVVYLSAITLAILPPETREGLLQYLKASRQTVAFDSNYRPRLWSSTSVARSTISAWWDAADILLPSIDDEMALFDETPEQVEARFMAMQKQGALKRGAQGPLPLGKTTHPKATYPPAPSIVDTTAAGDSFNGGYLASLLSDQDQGDALMNGHLCASQVVGHRGAIIPAEVTEKLYNGLASA